jgi:predicted RNA binding protein YcfA (HicA-like mRNA interferase family)
MKLSSKHKATLTSVFEDPVSANIAWRDVEKLLVAVGCDVVEGNGSRVRFVHESKVVATFHRPHPEKEAKRYQIKDAREFLTKIGVEP